MIVQSSKQFYEVIKRFTDVLIVDTETDGLEPWKGHRLCSIGICNENKETFYFPFRHKDVPLPYHKSMGDSFPLHQDNLPLKLLPVLFKAIQKAKILCGHNIKYDLAMMHQDGYVVPDEQRIEDTIILGRLFFYDSYEKLNLENVAIKVLEMGEDEATRWKTEFKTYLKENKIGGSKAKGKALEDPAHYDWGEIDVVGKYCEGDVEKTFLIRKRLLKYILDSDQTRIWDQECDLLRVLWDIEREGMMIDEEYCHTKIPMLSNRVEELQNQIYSIVGEPFDINSMPSLGKAMKSLGFKSHLTTDTGREKWNLEVMLSIEHPIAKMVLQYREAYKMLNTYFIPYSTWPGGVLHPSFKSWGTATGRMSCVNPNLQNVTTKPIDTAGEKVDEKVQEIFKKMSKSSSVSSRWIGRITKFEEKDTTVAVKRLFVPPEGYKMYMIDFTQMEMRIFSEYVGDPGIIAQLEDESLDFHSLVAKEIWKVEETDHNWKFYRSIAKAINFGMIYGIGVNKLSQQIDKSVEEATEYKKQYFAKFPAALEFMNKVKYAIIKRGHITNKFGRRYYIPKDKAYIGVNYLVQGSSADLVKNRMIAINDYLRVNEFKSRMVAQIHDEIVFYIHEDEENPVVNDVKDIMEERLLQVFLSAEVSKGFPSWSEKKGVCLKCFSQLEKDEDTGAVIHKCPTKKKRAA